MNWNICIIESITNIHNYGSESIHSLYIKFYPQLICMWYWTKILMKANASVMRNKILIMTCKKFPCIIIVTLMYTCSNEIAEDPFSTREVFDWYGIWKKVDIIVIIILDKWIFLQNWRWVPLRDSPMILGVFGFYGILTYRRETTSQYLCVCSLSFYMRWYSYWVSRVDSDSTVFHLVPLLMWWVILH